MSLMPNAPRTNNVSHEAAVEAIQRWIWYCIANGWDPTRPDTTRWTHEDNQVAMGRGWMIAQPPGSPHLALFSTRGRIKDIKALRDRIIAAAPIDPISGKAIAVLTAQRMQHPEIKSILDD